jgi:hypothetical protein
MMENANHGMRCEIELTTTAKLGHWATRIMFTALDLFCVKNLTAQEKEVAFTISGSRWIAEQRERGKKALDVLLGGKTHAMVQSTRMKLGRRGEWAGVLQKQCGKDVASLIAGLNRKPVIRRLKSAEAMPPADGWAGTLCKGVGPSTGKRKRTMQDYFA